MSNIREIIGQELAQKGAISFERFMELALYCPDFGYYERPGKPVGRGGDFYTSVSVGGLFGELLAWQFAQWLQAPAGSSCHVLEAGAHDGRLSADILKWLREQRPDIFHAVEYWLLEPSANRREAQKKTLQEFAAKVRWFENWDALPPDGVRGIIFSNELLDAMPIRRVGWDAVRQKWFEWGVTLEGDKFASTRLPADEELDLEIRTWSLPTELLRVLPDGFTTEFGAAARKWWGRAAQSLKEGKLLTSDYGLEREDFFKPERRDGTLRAYYRHHLETDLLARPGEQDITAQVNFTSIAGAGEAAGLKTESFIPQAGILMKIVEEACRKDPAHAEWISKQAGAFQTLTHPEHLGRAFRVLLQSR